tara:strand:+ start:729 stop:992 length:264 start_codon:yes stop_codon:yes gene_type:complete
MTTEQRDNIELTFEIMTMKIEIYIGAISGGLTTQQEAILDIERGYPMVTSKEQYDLKYKTLNRARNLNRDLIRQVKELERLVSEVKL